eukprot:TRINITY_DN7942_c0_g1_i1.p1 TRINITY_DN7942_c0_g1~~TRINITY_DN7942_c0_g1_i1.p1  ORF type:complete len:248 (+),score=83.99 TRINITY_DN7942_c0_g1_i1:196-939(+)
MCIRDRCMGIVKFGDNDSLSALVGLLTKADWVFLMTDVDALYNKNPNDTEGEPAVPLRVVSDFEELKKRANVGDAGSAWGTGGMATKVKAARLANAAGIKTAVISASQPEAIAMILEGSTEVGTQFIPCHKPVSDYKRWLMAMPIQGSIVLDAGAVRAVKKKNSLFASGMVAGGIQGKFQRWDVVMFCDEAGEAFARGMVNYSAPELGKLCGAHSSEFEQILGYNGQDEVAARDNIVLIVPGAKQEE